MMHSLFTEKQYRLIDTQLIFNNMFFLFVVLALFSIQNAQALEVGDKIPSCLLKKPDTSSTEINLSQFEGQVLYVDFWASWCGPCAQSFPFMNKLENTLKQRGLQIVAVNLDENIGDAQQFLDKLPANFTIALDADQQCAKEFDVPAMPTTYLIDRKGMVRYIHLGFRTGEIDELQAMVNTLLAEVE